MEGRARGVGCGATGRSRPDCPVGSGNWSLPRADATGRGTRSSRTRRPRRRVPAAADSGSTCRSPHQIFEPSDQRLWAHIRRGATVQPARTSNPLRCDSRRRPEGRDSVKSCLNEPVGEAASRIDEPVCRSRCRRATPGADQLARCGTTWCRARSAGTRCWCRGPGPCDVGFEAEHDRASDSCTELSGRPRSCPASACRPRSGRLPSRVIGKDPQ